MRTFSSISVCVITNGQRIETTARQLASLSRLQAEASIPVEIIYAGEVSAQQNLSGVRTLKMQTEAKEGLLGAMRNAAFHSSQGDVIVFSDDDILFPPNWLERLQLYSTTKAWCWLGNRILSPQGDRYWDRAQRKPHRLADYAHNPADPNLYQTGAFSIFKREVCEKLLWNPTLPFYADAKGYPENEDLEYSRRLFEAGYQLDFDQNNFVWHADSNYVEVISERGYPITNHLKNLNMNIANKLAARPLHPEFPCR